VRVAVIIAAYDIAPFVGDAVSSVLAQSHADLSLIVVDDGSRDETAAIVGAVGDPRLTLVRQANRGLPAARNRGAAEAGGAEALLFLDGDDFLTPDAVARLVEALRRDPPAVAAHGPFAFVSEAARPGTPGRLDRRMAPRQARLLSRLMVGNLFANGGHVLIRAPAWTAAGPFADLSYAEDWEFWLRLALQGRFASIGGSPLLFVRRRVGSMMHIGATLSESYRPVLAAIAANRAIETSLGPRRFRKLLRRAEAECSWTIGRELLRRGRRKEALGPLRRGAFGRPKPLRLALLALVAAGRFAGR
jgi:glycosyltransferase involved in cell wall biosynthesis